MRDIAIDAALRSLFPDDSQSRASWRPRIARALDAANFSPVGDNHHNAAACPYCSQHQGEEEQGEAIAVSWPDTEAGEGKRIERIVLALEFEVWEEAGLSRAALVERLLEALPIIIAAPDSGEGAELQQAELIPLDSSQPQQQPVCASPECETPGCTCPESDGQPETDRHLPGCLYRRAIEVLEQEGPEGWEGHPPGQQGPLTAAEVESVRRVVDQLQDQPQQQPSSPPVKEAAKFFCNKCGTFSPTAEHDGCDYLAGPVVAEEGEPDGAALIAAERQRQVEAEGWTPEHDDAHTHGELAQAGGVYAMPWNGSWKVTNWPWERESLKLCPSSARTGEELTEARIRELSKAGALVAAEIDRLRRLYPPSPQNKEQGEKR